MTNPSTDNGKTGLLELAEVKAELVERLLDEAMVRQGRGIDRGCVDCSLSGNLLIEAADFIEQHTRAAPEAADRGVSEALEDEVRDIAEDSRYSNEMIGIAVRNWFHRQSLRSEQEGGR